MEKKNKSVEGNKVSVTKIKKDFSAELFKTENFLLTPLFNLHKLAGEPNTIDGMVVLVIVNGTVKISINGRNFDMRPNTLLLLRKDSQVSSFKCSKACTGYLIYFSTAFLNSINLDTADQFNTNMMFGLKPCLTVTPDNIVRLHSLASMIGRTINMQGAYVDKTQLSLFNAFFYMLASIIHHHATVDLDLDPSYKLSRGEELMRAFAAELAISCEKERSVEYYAAQLGITPKYLSLVCKKKMGRNASKIIDDAVIHKAKELLSQPGVSIQEVSRRLNFVSQSFFGKYFKQRTGISPSRYKVQG